MARPRSPREVDTAALSIGALAAATGVPVETIRTWERRYGFPIAERKASGHRRYPVETVARLRRIAQVITGGHRAADVVPASDAALARLLASLEQSPADAPGGAAGSRSFDELIAAVRGFDIPTLRRAFAHDWAHLGPLAFLETRAAPLMHRVGDAWATGDLDVRHEHAASAALGDFLRAARAPHDDRASGPVVALATLNGEQHGLGLQMAATIFSLAGWRTVIIGVDTPVEELVAMTSEIAADVVAISCVVESDQLRGSLEALRQGVGPALPIIAGGRGTRAGVPDSITLPGSLRQLDRWARSRHIAR